MRYLRQFSRQMKIFGCVVMFAVMSRVARPQSPDEGGVSFDGGGHEILESIFVPYIANAPFTMTLASEWVRPLPNGGTFTVVNSRPIKRDSVGRIYQERWLMAPKGTNIRSRMSWIQISDPVAKTLHQCNAFTKVCAW
jgi:hypothetical protein